MSPLPVVLAAGSLKGAALVRTVAPAVARAAWMARPVVSASVSKVAGLVRQAGPSVIGHAARGRLPGGAPRVLQVLAARAARASGPGGSRLSPAARLALRLAARPVSGQRVARAVGRRAVRTASRRVSASLDRSRLTGRLVSRNLPRVRRELLRALDRALERPAGPARQDRARPAAAVRGVAAVARAAAAPVRAAARVAAAPVRVAAAAAAVPVRAAQRGAAAPAAAASALARKFPHLMNRPLVPGGGPAAQRSAERPGVADRAYRAAVERERAAGRDAPAPRR